MGRKSVLRGGFDDIGRVEPVHYEAVKEGNVFGSPEEVERPPNADVRESGLQERVLQFLPHLRMAAICREKPRERGPGRAKVLAAGFQERGFDEHFTAGDDAAGFQYPFHLGQHRPCVENVHENGVAVGDVEHVVFEGKGRNVSNVEGRVGVSTCPGGGPCHANLRLLHVDAVYLPGINRPRKTDRDGPRPTAEVENA